MTVPGPPEPPTSRRAARELREGKARRARDRAVAPGAADTSAPSTRRAAREQELLHTGEDLELAEGGPARHARPKRVKRAVVVAGIATAGALLLGSAAAVTAMVAWPAPVEEAAVQERFVPRHIERLPVPEIVQSPVTTDLCSIPEFVTALEARDDEAAIVAAGGGEAFRAAVASGHAACVDLSDPARLWGVINKLRPAQPIDYSPAGLVMPEGVRNIEGGALRGDAASALTSLVTAARDAGAGEIALESGFRSYQTQQDTYARHYEQRGDQADHVSARPGHSEHQTGLGADVVACDDACGTLDDLAVTPQGQWVAAHAWEHGWIVRYVDGATGVTGYLPEPWHLRYVGPELARAYHDGGWTSLEEFFGLPPAPDYAP